MTNVGEARNNIQRRVDEPEKPGGDRAGDGGGGGGAQMTPAFDALLAQGLRAAAAGGSGAAGVLELRAFAETAGETAADGGERGVSRTLRGDGGAADRGADAGGGGGGGGRGGGRVDGGARSDVDDVAARELATATARGPDPLGLTSAVAKEATSEAGEAAERQNSRRGSRANDAGHAERGAGWGRGERGGAAERQGESRADAARGGGADAVRENVAANSAAASGGAASTTGAAQRAVGAAKGSDGGADGGVGAAGNVGGGKSGMRGETAAGVPMPRGAVGQADSARAWSVKSGKSEKAATAKPHEPVALQASRAIAAAMKVDGDGVVSLKLAPDALGELRIQLHMKGERVSASIEAQSVEARDLLKQTSDVLRLALEARGLSVERIDVTLKEAAADSGTGGRDEGGAGGEPGASADRRGDEGKEMSANLDSGSGFGAGHADGDRRGSRESAAQGGAAGRMVSVGVEEPGVVQVARDVESGWMTVGVDAVA